MPPLLDGSPLLSESGDVLLTSAEDPMPPTLERVPSGPQHKRARIEDYDEEQGGARCAYLPFILS